MNSEWIVDAEWPAAGHAVVNELTNAPGRLCLICGHNGNVLADRFAVDIGLRIGSVGGIITEGHEPPDPGQILDLLTEYQVLTDGDVLFWPDVAVIPIGLLRALARRRPLVAVWPGEITGHQATYSTLGKPDYYKVRLTDMIVLRPRPTRFPDEIPYSVERIVT